MQCVEGRRPELRIISSLALAVTLWSCRDTPPTSPALIAGEAAIVAPADVEASATSAMAIEISWAPVTGAARYDVRRRARLEGTWRDYHIVVRVEGGQTSWSDRQVAGLTAYRYQVRACDAGGCSGWSSAANARTPQDAATPATLAVVPVVSGLTDPIFLTAPPGDDRLFIVTKNGRVRVVKDGTLLPTPFLNISAKITSGGERGLLGLAFHPDFAWNGFFYVNYTDLNGNTRIERYHAAPGSDVADAGSARLVIGYDQPFANHNGGMLQFGPDGMLWIGTGDGGSANDPNNNGQSLGTVLGKMLRLNVNGTNRYRVPRDNPFVGVGGARAEIWAQGLRNPWRHSFDRATDRLYIADVGQDEWEEVHVAPLHRPAVNFGWRIMEGAHCRTTAPCDMTGLEVPVHEYSHDDGCSITGGFVYRGTAIPGLRGHYLYSDFCSGFLRSFRFEGGAATGHREWSVGSVGNVLSFGEDASGELYILARTNGTVYRIVGN